MCMSPHLYVTSLLFFIKKSFKSNAIHHTFIPLFSYFANVTLSVTLESFFFFFEIRVDPKVDW